MAKKKPLTDSENVTKSAPEFKPGNKPHLEYDGVLLNANVPWNELVDELVERGFTLLQVSDYAECSLDTVKELQESVFDNLSFRAGARIATMHYQHRPEFYAQ